MKLNEALGAVLQDIAHSRVRADMFSRDVSLEYAKDAVLRLFPVPRAEIRNAEVDLVFAVAKVEQKEVKAAEIAAPFLADSLTDLREELLRIPAKIARARELETLGDLAKDRRPVVEAQLDRSLKAGLDLAALAPQMIDDLPAFLKTVRAIAMRALEEVTAGIEGNVTFGAQFSRNAGDRVSAWVQPVAAAAKAAIDRASVAAVDLHLAVTKDELADVPATVLAHVKLNVEIRNYGWITTQDEEGRPTQKLVSE